MSAVYLFFPLGFNAVLQAQMTINNPLDSAIITVEGAQSPKFGLKTNHLLVPALKDKISSLLPQSLIITNVSGRSIWGVTVVYTYPHSFAPSGHPYKTIVHVAVGGMADGTMMLMPNQMVFITPALGIYATSSHNGENGYLPPLDNSTNAFMQRFRLKHPSPSEVTEASVDSIIFEDGTILGPDAAGYAIKLNEQIRAERDLIAATRAAHGSALMQTIQNLSNLPAQSEYSKQMRTEALFIKGILDTQGEIGATTVLDRLSRGAWFVNGDTVRRPQ